MNIGDIAVYSAVHIARPKETFWILPFAQVLQK
jgi:hypothetical protein